MSANPGSLLAQRHAEDVRALCERVGYGFVMQQAARLWAAQDPVGAFAVGPCLVFTRPASKDESFGCGWQFNGDLAKLRGAPGG